MFNTLKARYALIAGLLLLSVWLVLDRGITYGLDLQGGTHLALEVQDPEGALTTEQRVDAIDRALRIIRTRVDELGVAEPVIQKAGQERIIVELPGATQEQQQRAKDIIQKSAFLQFQIVQPVSEIAAVLPRIDRAVAARLGAGGETGEAGAAPVAGAVGGLFESAGDSAAAADSAVADTASATAAAAVDTAAAARPFTSKLAGAGQTGAEGVFAVAAEDVPYIERALALPEVAGLLPRGVEFVWGVEEAGAQGQPLYRTLYLLDTEPLITGEYLVDAQAQRDPQLGQPEVVFEMNRRGGRQFERGTGQHINEQMAIVLDERVFSAPTIQSAIGTNGRITMGGGTIEEARDLALVLRAGALPAPIRIVEERSVGPSLGADSIENGKVAAIVGIGIVILFMLVFYKVSGALAVVALGAYVVYSLGMLASIGAALTFPGIAGLVLSVGMAVDANVLVYERIREELDAARTLRVAVDEGFRNALPAIIDSNLTTLITCLVLYQFGTGPVRGFAVTLAIGIIASMFTAVFVTRTLFLSYISRRAATSTISI